MKTLNAILTIYSAMLLSTGLNSCQNKETPVEVYLKANSQTYSNTKNILLNYHTGFNESEGICYSKIPSITGHIEAILDLKNNNLAVSEYDAQGEMISVFIDQGINGLEGQDYSRSGNDIKRLKDLSPDKQFEENLKYTNLLLKIQAYSDKK